MITYVKKTSAIDRSRTCVYSCVYEIAVARRANRCKSLLLGFNFAYTPARGRRPAGHGAGRKSTCHFSWAFSRVIFVVMFETIISAFFSFSFPSSSVRQLTWGELKFQDSKVSGTKFFLQISCGFPWLLLSEFHKVNFLSSFLTWNVS